MVKITNGVSVFMVTNGAYEDVYRHQGYQIVGDKEHDFIPDASADAKTADEIFTEEIEKKPISQWSKEEVKRYAGVKHIDLTGTKSVNEAKEVIKNSMSV